MSESPTQAMVTRRDDARSLATGVWIADPFEQFLQMTGPDHQREREENPFASVPLPGGLTALPAGDEVVDLDMTTGRSADSIDRARPAAMAPDRLTSRGSSRLPPGNMGQYSMVTLIGRGATSTVYKGFDEMIHRWVAIKLFDAGDDLDPEDGRIAREVEITANLGKHPHIVQVFGVDRTEDGHTYIVMEYYERGSIADVIKRDGPLPTVYAIDIGWKIADAVGAAHKAGILHRDIKPQNVLMSEYGPALADFGIARSVTNLEWSVSLERLTPLHAPPEVLEGAVPTERSDIYSVGSTVYTMLSGRPPFHGPRGETLREYQQRALQGAIPPLPDSVPREVSVIVMRALERAPERRFDSATELRDELRAAGVGDTGRTVAT